MDDKLLVQILAVPGAAGVVVYLFKRALEVLLEQDRKIRKLESDHVLDKISDLDSRLTHLNIVVQDRLMPEIERHGATLALSAGRNQELAEALVKHGATIEMALPAIKSMIGTLSMYWKQTKEKP